MGSFMPAEALTERVIALTIDQGPSDIQVVRELLDRGKIAGFDGICFMLGQ